MSEETTDTALTVLGDSIAQTQRNGGPRPGPAEELFNKAVAAVQRQNEKSCLQILRTLVRLSEKRGARYEVDAEELYQRAKAVAGWRPPKKSKRETAKHELGEKDGP